MSDAPCFALLQLNGTAGAITQNRDRLKRAVEGAALNVGAAPLICIAPELALSGAPLKTLPAQAGFLELCQEQLQQLATELATGPALIAGCPEQRGPALYSSLFLVADGAVTRLCGRLLERALGYGQARRAPEPDTEIGLFARYGLTLAVVPGLAALQAPLPAADVLICADCEPFEQGLWADLEARCRAAAIRAGRPLLRVNPVGGNGSLIFPGGSLTIGADGAIRSRTTDWRQELLTETLAAVCAPAPAHTPEDDSIAEPDWGAVGNALILGIRDYVRKSGFTRAVLGLSGGMDSSLVAALAVEALGPDNVTGLLMPSRWSSQGSLDDAAALAKGLGIATHTVPITPLMDAYAAALAPLFQDRKPGLAEENIQARIRANLLMAWSNKFGAMLLSTGNKSEASVGYGTLYGDLAGSLAPIVDVYKTDVYKVAAWFNTSKGQQIIPRAVFTKAPSAELHPGQKDQDALPPYDALDSCLRVLFEGETLCERAASPAVDAGVLHSVAEMVRRSEFKRHQAPQGLFVSSRPLGLLSRPLPAVQAE